MKVILTRQEKNLPAIIDSHPHIHWISFPLIYFKHQLLSEEQKSQLKEYDWIIFTSQNAVLSLLSQTVLANSKIACVGTKTAHLVQQYKYEVDHIPENFTSLDLAKTLPVKQGESIAYIGGNLSSFKTIEALKNLTNNFLQVEVYQTLPKDYSKSQWEKLIQEKPDIISFCSPSAVKSFSNQLSALNLSLDPIPGFAAIGATTALSIKDYTGQDAILGEKFTFASMIEKIAEQDKL